MDEKLIPKGLHYCYSDGVWDGKVFRTKNCPYWKHTDHGTVKCEFLGVESLTSEAGEYEDKMRELAYKHFGSEEAALEATEEGWLLWDQLKICGINEEEETVLSLRRVSPTVKSPLYGTKKSARFDLHAALDHVEQLIGYDEYNNKINSLVVKDGTIELPPKSRVLIPTGYIFGIPEDNELTIVPRSSTSLKYGLFKANSVAVIDEDFANETHLMFYNSTNDMVVVKHNDRLAQAKVSPVIRVEFLEVEELDEVDSDRVGGLGSTGN